MSKMSTSVQALMKLVISKEKLSYSFFIHVLKKNLRFYYVIIWKNKINPLICVKGRVERDRKFQINFLPVKIQFLLEPDSSLRLTNFANHNLWSYKIEPNRTIFLVSQHEIHIVYCQTFIFSPNFVSERTKINWSVLWNIRLFWIESCCKFDCHAFFSLNLQAAGIRN